LVKGVTPAEYCDSQLFSQEEVVQLAMQSKRSVHDVSALQVRRESQQFPFRQVPQAVSDD